MAEQKKRPMRITAIGCIELVLSGGMALATGAGFHYFSAIDEAWRSQPEIAFLAKFFPFILAWMFIITILLFISAIFFLKLKPWARRTLEAAHWIAVAGITICTVYWLGFLAANATVYGESTRTMIALAFSNAVLAAMMAAPFGFTLILLRARDVKQAFSDLAEQHDGQGLTPPPLPGSQSK